MNCSSDFSGCLPPRVIFTAVGQPLHGLSVFCSTPAVKASKDSAAVRCFVGVQEVAVGGCCALGVQREGGGMCVPAAGLLEMEGGDSRLRLPAAVCRAPPAAAAHPSSRQWQGCVPAPGATQHCCYHLSAKHSASSHCAAWRGVVAGFGSERFCSLGCWGFTLKEWRASLAWCYLRAPNAAINSWKCWNWETWRESVCVGGMKVV